MPKIDLSDVPVWQRSSYPGTIADPVKGRSWQALGAHAGLVDFGVNLVRLAPGAWSSQRHWHRAEDEFLVVLSGTPTEVTEAGEAVLGPGDCAAYPKGKANAHHLINRTEEDVLFLVVGGDSKADVCTYPDVPMVGRYNETGAWIYTQPDGTAFMA